MENILEINKEKDLKDYYNFYFHDPNSLNWEKETYESLCKIDFLDELYVLNFLIKTKISKGMFFLMKKDVFPQWDNDDNKDGGTVSMKVPENETSYYWNEISLNYVLNNLIKKNNDTDNLIDESIINGISISPKKNFSIIKFWINDKTKINSENLKNYFKIPEKYIGDLIFKSHFN